jgi:hypothetical protein
MIVSELLERLRPANLDLPIEIIDASGRGLKLEITDGRWAVQIGSKAVFIRIADKQEERYV